MKRVAGVRGVFYPKDCQEIESMIKNYNNIIDNHIKDRSILKSTPRAIISPHAGYIYSGFSANLAHRIAANSNPKRVVVIGPSHHVFIDGISGSFMDTYETPCGNIKIDTNYLDLLKKSFNLSFIPKAHTNEHSTETQMPFIKHYLPNASLIELIYGRVDPLYLAKLISNILEDRDNLVVISTDLSHFHTLKDAKKLDHICLEAIDSLDAKMLDRGCEACGMLGVKAILEVAKVMEFKSRILDYRTSANVSGDESRVVGYMSAIFL